MHDLDIELKYLNNLVLLSNQHELTASPTDITGLPSPPPLPHSHSSSGNSLKLRFPFKRTASTSTHLPDDHPIKLMTTNTTSPSSILMMERISQSIKLMTDYRQKIATAYTETLNSIDRSGTALNNLHRSSSLFSYGGISDTFFDAEEEFIVSGEEEEEEEGSVYASITVDSEDEERGNE